MNEPLFFASPDLERALGLEDRLPNWHILCTNKSPIVEMVRERGGKVFCLQEHDTSFTDYSTLGLLKHPETQTYITQHALVSPQLLVFKVDASLERLAQQKQWTLLNPPSQLNHLFEHKISQYTQLAQFREYFPLTKVGELGSLTFTELHVELGLPFIVQFERGHTGSGTLVMHNEQMYSDLQKQFPKRQVRLSRLLEGVPWTINACTTRWGVFMGGLSRQLTGLSLSTKRPQATVGNDWAQAESVSVTHREQIRYITEQIGTTMYKEGFRGMFGLDFIVTPDKVYMIEINARQTASISTHNRLLLTQKLLPLMYLHLLEFLTPDHGEPQALVGTLPLPGQPLPEYRQVYNSLALIAPRSSQLFLRNIWHEQARLKSDLKPGVYTIVDNVVTFLRSGYNIADLHNENEVLLWSNAYNRPLELEQEVARVQANSSLVKPDNTVTGSAQLYIDYLKLHVET